MLDSVEEIKIYFLNFKLDPVSGLLFAIMQENNKFFNGYISRYFSSFSSNQYDEYESLIHIYGQKFIKTFTGGGTQLVVIVI